MKEYLDAQLTDKRQMSTAALVAGLFALFSQTMLKEDFIEVKEIIDVLYDRWVIKPAMKGSPHDETPNAR